MGFHPNEPDALGFARKHCADVRAFVAQRRLVDEAALLKHERLILSHDDARDGFVRIIYAEVVRERPDLFGDGWSAVATHAVWTSWGAVDATAAEGAAPAPAPCVAYPLEQPPSEQPMDSPQPHEPAQEESTESTELAESPTRSTSKGTRWGSLLRRRRRSAEAPAEAGGKGARNGIGRLRQWLKRSRTNEAG